MSPLEHFFVNAQAQTNSPRDPLGRKCHTALALAVCKEAGHQGRTGLEAWVLIHGGKQPRHRTRPQ